MLLSIVNFLSKIVKKSLKFICKIAHFFHKGKDLDDNSAGTRTQFTYDSDFMHGSQLFSVLDVTICLLEFKVLASNCNPFTVSMPCSSKNLTDALRNFGNVYSIHILGMCKCLQGFEKTEFVALGLCQDAGVSENVLCKSVKLVSYVLCA